MPRTFHIENFGCRAARADGEAIAALLRASGAHEGRSSEADVVIVNTCSVTAEADREARAYIRRTNRLNPTARIVATGCYAQRAPQELAGVPGVSAVIGNSHKALAPQIALQLASSNEDAGESTGHSLGRVANADERQGASATDGPPPIVSVSTLLAASANQPLILADDAFAHSFLDEAPVTLGAQTRPNLKIQEGCSNRCSFCVIPQTRGNSRSLSAESILSHVRSFVAAGGNELVLSGINLGRWGRELAAHNDSARPESASSSVERKNFSSKGTGFSPYIGSQARKGALAPEGSPRTLAALIRVILEQTNLPRLRLSSIEPMDWDADIIGLLAKFGGTRLARHAHLPLQSGSDSVLRRMHRRYRPWHYAEKVSALLCAAGPALTLGADVMVGFPGESDREFQETFDFIRLLPFGYLHLFPFSARPGTRAWTLHAESPVAATVVNERMTALRSLADEKMHAHRRQFIGAELDAITLHTPPALTLNGQTSALTENFLPVELAAALPANRLVRIRVNGLVAGNTLIASPVLPATSASDSPLEPLATSDQPVLETAF